jgi:PIN domain nuclease of toxin-antitoxin system
MGQIGVILLDTHTLVWLISEPAKLSRDARTAIEQARRGGEGLAIVDITLLELAALAGRGRIEVRPSLESLLDDVQARFAVRTITARACAKTLELPTNYPKDPADRIIGATALVEGIPLITADRGIRRSKAVQTIW